MIVGYFAYGSNMNPDRVRTRGLEFHSLRAACLHDTRLVFDKVSSQHPGVGHANMVYAPGDRVEGVLYQLKDADEIIKMDRFERAPINYSREVVQVHVGLKETSFSSDGTEESVVACWTYFANPAVRQSGLLPPRSYLEHLLQGRAYLSERYYQNLAAWPCQEN